MRKTDIAWIGAVWFMLYSLAFAVTGNVWYLALSFPLSWIGTVTVIAWFARRPRPTH